MMNRYPSIIGEYETLEAIRAGASIARFGDGEFNIIRGRKCVSQCYDPKLADEMRRALHTGSTKKLLIGVPPLDNLKALPLGDGEKTKKTREFWHKQVDPVSKLLNHDAKYHSSFISRPNEAPHICTKAYAERVIDLWRGKGVTLVRGSERSLKPDNIKEASSINDIVGVYSDGYASIDDIEKQIRLAGNKIVIMCYGATATALAWRLAGEFHALDLGHIGWLIDRYKRGNYDGK